MIVKLKMKILVRKSLKSKHHAYSIEDCKLRNFKGKDFSFFLYFVSWHMTDRKIRERALVWEV